jgi:hypothetical protein
MWRGTHVKVEEAESAERVEVCGSRTYLSARTRTIRRGPACLHDFVRSGTSEKSFRRPYSVQYRDDLSAPESETN